MFHAKSPRIAASIAVALAFGALLAPENAGAQTGTVLATGLKAPMKISLTPGGNLLVSEAGTGPNTGRVSLVKRDGTRTTILDGLPSGLSAVGENSPSGPAGIEQLGDAWYLVIGAGDESLPGAAPGLEIANPNPASPILSSVLKLRFSSSIDSTFGNFVLTPAQHVALKGGRELVINNPATETLRVSLLVDFPDLTGPRSSNPFGILAFGSRLYVVDASLNAIQSVDPVTGVYVTAATFAPLSNPSPPPPVVDAVPDSIRSTNGQFLVSFLTGFPFTPGRAEVRLVDPATGASTALLTGLNSAIDVLPVVGAADEYLALEFSVNQSVNAPGRLLLFNPASAPPTVVASDLITPTNMAFDRTSRELFVTEFGPGRIRRLTLGGVIPPLPCGVGSTTMCLAGGRFQVQASWRSAQASGVGIPVALTDTTGHFWFFSADNVEVFVKVVRGCGFNSRFWVFAGGMTNVEVTLTVTDTQTGVVKTYVNPLNTPFAPIQDTNAFGGCPVTFP
ncbi:MAG: ScyD/ScyE family protein [Acidobacteria bacterium]|nr:ScyD/ScyE family protein [Acidobacteriota bacterium]MCA1611152.1 ScyD/ScyE family protein [Acidobacteriota bacterium]